jgi:uncharacterized protein (DUF433 family)
VKELSRITFNPEVMGGKPCIRCLRVTVGTIVGLMASGRTPEEILAAYPYLERSDIYEALSYAAWRVEEIDLSLTLFATKLSEASFSQVWDNSEDAAYDNL